MATSPNLSLPYILAAQAQKHVTHNEAVRALDALVQISVLDRDLAGPPGSPADGARYIVAASPSGAWSGHAGKLAAWQDGAWEIYTPREGWVAWVADEDILVAWNGSSWVTAGGGGSSTSLNPASGGLVGVNATADTTNRLSVASPASLFNHEGAGHQQKINKAAAGDTAATLFQTGFSGRAEAGLLGDDNYHVKVSADGAAWKDALIVDRATGAVSMPFTALEVRPNLLINPDFRVNQRAFAFGALADGTFGVDRWKAVGATDLGWVATTNTLTINAGAIRQVVEPLVFGIPSLASTQVTLSVEGLSNGNLGVQVGSASGTITAGSGWRSVTLTLGAGDSGNLTVTLTPSSYPVWFHRVKLEVGASASAWVARPLPQEQALCQRYFFTTYAGSAPATASAAAGAIFVVSPVASNWQGMGKIVFPVPMRATPTCTIYAASSGDAGQISADGGQVPGQVSNIGPTGAAIYVANSAVGANVFLSCHLVAQCEF